MCTAPRSLVAPAGLERLTPMMGRVEAGKGRGTLGEKLFGSLVLFQACYTATPVCNRDLHSSARNLCTKQRRAKHDAGSTRILGILWSKCK